MADISNWSTDEKQNVELDGLTLSGEGGLYIAKIMAAVKAACADFETRIAALEAEDDTEPTEPSEPSGDDTVSGGSEGGDGDAGSEGGE